MDIQLIEGALSAEERALLDSCEQRIDAAINAWYEAGDALRIIRDERLYRERFETFGDYCEKIIERSQNYANKLIRGAEITKVLSTIVPELPAPKAEGQARQLAAFASDPDALGALWRVVHQTAPGGVVTASHIKSVVEVCQDALRTGAIDGEDGESVAVSSLADHAINQITYERMQRQKQYIQQAQGGGAKLYSDVLEVGEDGYVEVGSLPPGAKVRVVIYEVVEVKDHAD